MTHMFTGCVKLRVLLFMDLFFFYNVKKKITNSLLFIIIISDDVFPEKCIDTKVENI